MAVVFLEFEAALVGPDGTAYRAQACGAHASDGTDTWEGWIDFVPIGGGERVRSRRETTQPTQKDTAYWASGLSPVYLQGVLERTLAPDAVMPPLKNPGVGHSHHSSSG
jgi:hypothetical protein